MGGFWVLVITWAVLTLAAVPATVGLDPGAPADPSVPPPASSPSPITVTETTQPQPQQQQLRYHPGGHPAGATPGRGGPFWAIPPPLCLQAPIPYRMLEWYGNAPGSQDQPAPPPVVVEWAYGNDTCSTVNSCFGLGLPQDKQLVPQILPLQIQRDTQVSVYPSRQMDVPFGIRVFRVDDEGFRTCNSSWGVALTTNTTADMTAIPAHLLQPGVNLFIAESSDPLFECKFGFRLNVTVKSPRCHGVGEKAHCWNSGRCVANISQPFFQCQCCVGYNGDFCEDLDACASSPCASGATCIDILADATGSKFACQCPFGFLGATCDRRVENLCEVSPCQNDGTCVGNKTAFQCMCTHGYSGDHCEVDTDDCQGGPCINGVCVDRLGDYQCFCPPGHGGRHCDRKYEECKPSPCRNEGFCVDLGDAFECHCPRGYTGSDCSIKVDLCNPSPCANATDCVDSGPDFYCVCKAGYTGTHCEININECGSNPCQNGGKCFDGLAGYRCICPDEVHGIHCETVHTQLSHLSPENYYSVHQDHVHNLYMIAGTLAGALTIALAVLLGCYCKVHETYRLIACKLRGYRRHHNETSRRVAPPSSHLADARPTMESILDAAVVGYSDSTMKSPLVTSLKPKRV